MDSDLLFIVNYTCPRCHVDLEVREAGAPRWLRCPRCGKASLPPEYDRIPTPPEYFEPTIAEVGTYIFTAEPLPIRPRSMAPLPPHLQQKTPNIRLLLGVVFFMTTILFLFSLLESNGLLAGFSGLGAAISLFLLTRPTGRNYGE